jgi:putative ABC transport system permease protein
MFGKLVRQLRFLLNRGRSETDLEREIRFHIEVETRKHVDEGMPETEARRRALADFGSIPLCQETVREAWGLRIWSDLRRDFQYAFRMIHRKPGFALMAILTMAIGVGATTAVFAVFDRAILRPLPFGDPERLVYIGETRPTKEFGEMAASYPNFQDWKQSNHSFDDIAGFNGTNFTVTGFDLPFRISAVRVTTNFLSVLRVRPQLGRDFLKEEEPLDNSHVVIITDGFWHRLFGARPDVLGQTLQLGGVPHAIVGVLPANFRFASGGASDLIVPLGPTADQRTRRQFHWLFTVARLRDGATATEADTEMKAIAARLAAEHADTNAGTSARVVPLQEQVVASIRPTFGVISGAAIFMFCLALANLANLMIAQSATRQREMAIRTAIGAGTMRLGRHLLAESLALAAIAAIASLVVANLTLQGITRSIPRLTLETFPSVAEASVDARTAAFAFLLAMLGGLVAGGGVVFRLSRNPLADAIRRDSASAHESQRLRSIFIVAEVALAVTLLVGAIAMLRSVQELLRVNPGFLADKRLSMRLALPQAAYPKSENVATFYESLRNRVAQLPGVEEAGVIDELPLTTEGGRIFVYAYSQTEPKSGNDGIETVIRSASVNYFETMGIPLKSGRTFTTTDRSDSTRVALINEMLATRLFGKTNPVGQRLAVTLNRSSVYEIVGVVGDVALKDLDSSMRPTMYTTLVQDPSRGSHLVIKTALDPEAMARAARGVVQRLDTELPVYAVRSLDETINLTSSVVTRRLVLFLLGAFSVVGAVMAGVGLYGLMSFVVAQRSREIGIRIALGAEHRTVKRLVLNQALRMTVIGLVIGTGLAIGSGQLIRSVVFGVVPSNPTILITVALIVGIITYAACYAPVRRALRFDPATVLRHD